MKYFVVFALLFFSAISFAAEITSYEETAAGIKNEQVRLAKITAKFPSGRTAIIEEIIEKDTVLVHLLAQDASGKKIESVVVAFEPIEKLPNQPNSTNINIKKEQALYDIEDKDNFVVIGTRNNIVVIREDGESVRLHISTQDSGKNINHIEGFEILRMTNDNISQILSYKYQLNGKQQIFETKFKEEVKSVSAPAAEVKVPAELNQKALLLGESGAVLKIDGKRQVITKDKVLQYSVLGKRDAPNQIEIGNEQNSVSILVTEKEIFLVTDKGIVRKVEADRKRIKTTSISVNEQSITGIEPYLLTFESEGKAFALLSFEYEYTSPPMGETFVLDLETNEMVRVAYKTVTPVKDPIQVHDGILTIAGIVRQIDLRNLKAENRFFQVSLPPVLKDTTNSNYDAIAETEQTFPNIAEDFRTGRKKAFELDEASKSVIDSLTAAMGQKESPNPMIVAEAGTGKTALVYSFLDKVVKGQIPGIPRTVRIYELQVSTLEQGTMYTGMLSQRLKALEGAATQVPVIIFADEIHALRGSGTHKGNPDNDALSKLKPALMNGIFHMIGTSTEGEFNNAFSGDGALMRRFNLIKKPNPSREEVFKAIDSWTDRYGYPRLDMKAKEDLYDLSNRYVNYGAQPSKATSLMDKAFARKVYLQQSDRVITKEDMIDVLVANGADRKLFEAQTAAETLENLKKVWHGRMSGQEHARDAYFELEALRLGGLLNPNKPASLLVTGPRGAGKTRGAETYALGTNRRFVKLNMADYAEGGVREFQKRLAQEIFKDRFAVFLFDEIEKASPAIKNILLAILQDGKVEVPAKLTASASESNSIEVLDFTHSTIVCTSNAGEEFVVTHFQAGTVPEMGFSKPKEEKSELINKTQASVLLKDGLKNAAMADGLSSFLLDRFTLIVPAYPSNSDQFLNVVDINLTQMMEEIANSKELTIELVNKNEFLNFAVNAYFRPNMSNRIVEEMLHNHFRKWIAMALAKVDVKNIKKVLIEFDPQSGEAKVQALTTCEDALR